MKLLIFLQTILFIAFCTSGVFFFQSIRESGIEANIRNVIELTDNYKKSVICIKGNFEQSNQIVPMIETTVHSMGKALVKIMNFKVFGSQPMKNEKNLLTGLQGLQKTAEILKDYKEKTAPEIFASLEKTEKSLEKLNISLKAYQAYNQFYLYGFAAMIFAIFAVNMIIIILLNKELQLLKKKCA